MKNIANENTPQKSHHLPIFDPLNEKTGGKFLRNGTDLWRT